MLKKVLLILAIITVAYGGVVLYASVSPRNISTRELELTLKQREQQNPRAYLDINSTLSPNLVRKNVFSREKVDGYILEGTITNTASQAQFKDVSIEVTFYSKTDSRISSRDYLVYEVIPSRSSQSFSYKIDAPPPGYAAFRTRVVDAIPVYGR